MSAITTHILDTAHGHPARGVAVTLARRRGDTWEPVGQGVSDDDGRVGDLMAADAVPEPGAHRLRFAVGPYFDRLGTPTFYPWVDVVFTVADPNQHYHVHLLMAPWGHSTYRGS